MDPIQMSPILLSPGGRIVTVFGGGAVALRKCRHFDGFRIRVISLEVLPELRELAEEVVTEEIRPESIPGWIEGSDIVVAATSDHALNDMIRDISMSEGIMTNSACTGTAGPYASRPKAGSRRSRPTSSRGSTSF